MITWSVFTAYMVDNKGCITSSLWAEVSRAGKQRLVERMQAGVADSVLDFSDLIGRIENSFVRGAAIA